jgi:hypothetical protein
MSVIAAGGCREKYDALNINGLLGGLLVRYRSRRKGLTGDVRMVDD